MFESFSRDFERRWPDNAVEKSRIGAWVAFAFDVAKSVPTAVTGLA